MIFGRFLSFCYDKSNYHVYMSSTKISKNFQSYAQAINSRDEAIWKNISNISVISAAEKFLSTLKGNTKRSYKAAFNSIFDLFIKNNLFNPNNNLQVFSISNLEFLLDQIRSNTPGSVATKQSRSATFISFSRYLQRATGGIIRRVVPKKELMSPTFQQIRYTSVTKSLSKSEWSKFLQAVKIISFRDYLVAKTILQGAKRVSEVLCANIDQIDWNKKQIIFKQLKSKELEKNTVISYPDSFINELREYIGERKYGPIFITRNKKPLSQPHLYRTFTKASLASKLSIVVHPHVLRASAITYLSSCGYSAEQIMKISGHSDTKLVRYYDKRPLEDNLSKEVNLI